MTPVHELGAASPTRRRAALLRFATEIGAWAAIGTAFAQIAVSANDGKQVLVDGVQTVPDNPAPDSVAIIDMAHGTPRVLASIAVPTSVIGPPRSVAVAPDESYAIVTSARRISDADPHHQLDDGERKAFQPGIEPADHGKRAGAMCGHGSIVHHVVLST